MSRKRGGKRMYATDHTELTAPPGTMIEIDSIDDMVKEVIKKTRDVPNDKVNEDENELEDLYYNDYVEDKQLSKVISDIESILNKFRNKLSIEVLKDQSGAYGVTITARIQLRQGDLK